MVISSSKKSIKEKNGSFVTQAKQNDKKKVVYCKKYRNNLNQLIRSAERKHYHDLLIEHKSNIKKSWQIIKPVINKRKYNYIQKEIHCNGSIIDGLAKSIPSSCKKLSDYISYNAIDAFYFDTITENEISKVIGCFKGSAAGSDDIRGNVIEHIKNIVCIPLKHICNISLSLGVFPHELKIAYVVCCSNS